jgi:hypothetical protein
MMYQQLDRIRRINIQAENRLFVNKSIILNT